MERQRPRSDRLISAIGLALGLSAWASLSQPAMAQSNPTGNQAGCRPSSSTAPAEALRLAVKLKTYVDTTLFQHGAGIIIGDRADTLIVATAAHVVFDAGKPVDSIRAYFYTDCLKPVPATLCGVIDA